MRKKEAIRMDNCLVCERIDLIRRGENPYFVKELNTGYVVIGDHQRIRGYTVFLCKRHATELHLLEPSFRLEFLREMALVAEAVYRAFEPDKMNYELLGAGSGVHMHWTFSPGGRATRRSEAPSGCLAPSCRRTSSSPPRRSWPP